MKKIIKIKDIIFKDELYPRAKITEKVCQEYAKDMKKGDVFPIPHIALFKGKHYIVDGAHRIEANKINSEEYLQCNVQSNFPNLRAIFLAAVRANINHGRQMTDKDKLKSAMTLAKMKCNMNDISKLVGINMDRFNKIKTNKLSLSIVKQRVKEKKYPKEIILETNVFEEKPIISKAQMEEIEAVDDSVWQLMELNKIIDYLKTEVLLIENTKIRKKITQLKKLLKKKYSKC